MKKRTIINANDLHKAIRGEEVQSYKKKTANAANIAADICKAIVFLKEVKIEEKYFAGISTMEDLKAKYKELALQNHPDQGGDSKTMAEINAEYDQKAKELGGDTKKQDKTEEAARMTEEEFNAALAAEFKAVMEAVAKMNLDGVQVELIGSWLWISGNTKPIKDELKAAGFRWAPKKDGMPWVWHSSLIRYRSSRGRYTKQDIEEKHGCQVLKSA